jgi:hypothetical protein
MMGRQTTGNLVDGLGRHVACFSDGLFPRHSRGYDFEKRRNLKISVSRCLSESWITFNSLSNEPNMFLKCQKNQIGLNR